MEMNHTINSCCDYNLHVRLLYSPAWISSAKFTFKSPDLTWRSSAAGKHNITFMVKPLPLKNKTFHEYFPCGFTFIYHHAWAKLSNNVFCQSSPKLEVMIMWHFPNRKLTLIKLFFFLTVCRFPIINADLTTFRHHCKRTKYSKTSWYQFWDQSHRLWLY